MGKDQCGSEDKHNYHCTMAGVELEQYATGNEMSNQQSEKQSFPNTNLDRLGKTGRYLQPGSFTFLCIYRTRSDTGCNHLCCTGLEWVRTIAAPVALAVGGAGVAPQNYMVGGIELEQYSIGHETSNQQSSQVCVWRTGGSQEKQNDHCSLGKTGTTSQLHFSAMHNLYLGPFQSVVAGDCPTVVILVQLYLLRRSGLKWAQ